jgi:hypothetical protein
LIALLMIIFWYAVDNLIVAMVKRISTMRKPITYFYPM